MKFEPGSVIRFTYNHKQIDEESGDKFKEVLVLHPNWHGQLHAIDLKRLTPAEQEVLRAVLDPETKKKPHRFPLVNNCLKRMDPIEEIKNPMTFYVKFVRVIFRNKDVYRKYDVERMLNVSVVRPSAVKGGVINPKPLFKKSVQKSKEQGNNPDENNNEE